MITITQADTEKKLEQVRELKRSYLAWQRQTYQDGLELLEKYFDPKAFENELAALPGEFVPPSGRLLLASHDDIPAGTAALRDLGNQTCELKGMFVEPQFQGQGIGRALAETLIEQARMIGFAKMRLDTGPRQIAAQKLYHSLGFQDIEPYYALPDELAVHMSFMELILEDGENNERN